MSTTKISIPMDCVGEICGFVYSTIVFFKLYTLCKHSKWFFDEERSLACRNITFSTKYEADVAGVKKYVISLKLYQLVPLTFFPNLQSLWMDDYTSRNMNIYQVVVANTDKRTRSYYHALTKLNHLKAVSIGEGFDHYLVRLCSNELRWFRNVKILSVCHTNVGDDALSNLACVVELNISHCKNVRGLYVFRYLAHVEDLDLSKNTFLRNKDLSCFKSCKRLVLEQCVNIRDEGLRLLPNSVTEIDVSWTNVTNNGVASMSTVEGLTRPFWFTDMDIRVIKMLPNLKKLEIWQTMMVVPLLRVTGLIKIEMLYLVVNKIDERDFALLKNLTGLKILKLKTNVTMKGVEIIFKSCEKLKKLMIRNGVGVKRLIETIRKRKEFKVRKDDKFFFTVEHFN